MDEKYNCPPENSERAGESGIEMYRVDNHLRISAKNLPEFRCLIEQAKREAQQLNETISKLSRFEFDIEFRVEENQADGFDRSKKTISGAYELN